MHKRYNLHAKPRTDAPTHNGSYCFDSYGNRVERIPDPTDPGKLSPDTVLVRLAPGSPLTVEEVTAWYWRCVGAA